MNGNGGYIFSLKGQYADEFKDKAKKEIPFKETLSLALSAKYKDVQFHFVSTNGSHITYAVLVEQGRRTRDSVISKSQLKFYDYLEIDPPTFLPRLSQELDIEIDFLDIEETKESYKNKIDQKDWKRVIEEVSKTSQEVSERITTMLTKVSDYSFTGKEFNLMAQQKDAVQLAFNFTFDTREHRLDYSLPNIQKDQKPKDFLRFTKPNEDNLISHDILKFGKWKEDTDQSTPVTRTFKHGRKFLTVTNVNRNRQYEKTLGVDLIYYNHQYKSFMLVQYKVWQGDKRNYHYRPDEQYKEDIERMQRAESLIHFFSWKNKYLPFATQKLNSSPFYFKICHPTELSYNNEMITGSYLHYQYLNKLMSLRLGKNGGRIIYEKSLLNPLSNQLFIDLVKHGLIGSVDLAINELDEIVETLLERGDSITIAESFS